MSNRTLIIILVAIAAAFAGWWFWRRRQLDQVGAMNGAGAGQAYSLPPIMPAPGSQTYQGSPSFVDQYSNVAGAAARAACEAKGGGAACSLVAPVATKVSQVSGTIVVGTGKKVVSAASTVASGAKKLLGKLF